MTKLLGALLICLGVALGLYVGVWVMFVGGIVDVLQVGGSILDAKSLSGAGDGVALVFAIGIAKILFAGLCGWLAALLPLFLGMIVWEVK